MPKQKAAVVISTQEEERLEPLGGGFYAAVTKAHTFGSDALLLADFAAPRAAKRLCDLCAGCGIVSILWAAQGGNRVIDAVELQKDAAALIEKSAALNRFSNITVRHADLRALGTELDGLFDLAACNPPYFRLGAGTQSSDAPAAFARHEATCTLAQAVHAAARLLKCGGRLCLCHRPERLPDIFEAFRSCRLEPKRLRFVQQRDGSAPWLVLIEGKKGAKPGLAAEPAMLLEDANGDVSPEMRAIYEKLCAAPYPPCPDGQTLCEYDAGKPEV